MSEPLESIANPISRPIQGLANPSPVPTEIDPEELAKEVFHLIKEDLRRERERQGRQAHLGRETA